MTLPILLPLVDALSVYLPLAAGNWPSYKGHYLSLHVSLQTSIHPPPTDLFVHPPREPLWLILLRRLSGWGPQHISGLGPCQSMEDQVSRDENGEHCKTLPQQKRQQILWHAEVVSHARGYKRACKTWQAGAGVRQHHLAEAHDIRDPKPHPAPGEQANGWWLEPQYASRLGKGWCWERLARWHWSCPTFPSPQDKWQV